MTLDFPTTMKHHKKHHRSTPHSSASRRRRRPCVYSLAAFLLSASSVHAICERLPTASWEAFTQLLETSKPSGFLILCPVHIQDCPEKASYTLDQSMFVLCGNFLGGDGGECIIDCAIASPKNKRKDKNNKVALEIASSDVVLEGFTVRNADVTVRSDSSLSLSASTLFNSPIEAEVDSWISVDNSVLTDVKQRPALDTAGELHASQSIFRGNLGGAIQLREGAVAGMTTCTFEENKANQGGAIHAHAGTSMDARSCIFTDNHATEGGAVVVSGDSPSLLKFRSNHFQGNRAKTGPAVLVKNNFANIAVDSANVACDNLGKDLSYCDGVEILDTELCFPFSEQCTFPTMTPTLPPTLSPSASPTPPPTSMPTKLSTRSPSVSPTSSPSSVASAPPSVSILTQAPSNGPTLWEPVTEFGQVTLSHLVGDTDRVDPDDGKPSGVPTAEAVIVTAGPTDTTSDVPSEFPINIPTEQPSSVPTSLFTDLPTDIPSQSPSSRPSNEPSLTFTPTGSGVPSDGPSEIPSDVPSDWPSVIPSDVPSDAPSDVPSDAPSDTPSNLPSDVFNGGDDVVDIHRPENEIFSTAAILHSGNDVDGPAMTFDNDSPASLSPTLTPTHSPSLWPTTAASNPTAAPVEAPRVDASGKAMAARRRRFQRRRRKQRSGNR